MEKEKGGFCGGCGKLYKKSLKKSKKGLYKIGKWVYNRGKIRKEKVLSQELTI